MGRLCEQVRVDDEALLRVLRDLGKRTQAQLVTMTQLSKAMELPPEDLQDAVRTLESRGVLLCVPSAGPVAVMSIVDGALFSHDLS